MARSAARYPQPAGHRRTSIRAGSVRQKHHDDPAELLQRRDRRGQDRAALRLGRNSLDGSSAPMRPIFGFSSCAARSRILGCARSAARRFTRISATWIAESLAEAIRPSLGNPPPADTVLGILERDAAPLEVLADLVRLG